MIQRGTPDRARVAYEVGSMLLAVDIGLVLTILAGFEHLALPRMTTGSPSRRILARAVSRNADLAMAGCFLLSTWPPFFDTSFRGVSARTVPRIMPFAAIGVTSVIRNRPRLRSILYYRAFR